MVKEEKQKIRIKISSYDSNVLDSSIRKIIENIRGFSDTKFIGPIPLPTKIKKYTVNRSTFIYNNSREQFEVRNHKRLIDVVNPSQELISTLINISLPSGVSVDVKVLS